MADMEDADVTAIRRFNRFYTQTLGALDARFLGTDAPVEVIRFATIDGLPGYVSRAGGGVLQTTALDIRDGRIAAIYIVRNPDKLAHVVAALQAGQAAARG